jgi:HTH-type transcriptional regulator/antitoxin PezA
LNTRIKKVRNTVGLTQTEFGKKIGSARNTIANYENGNRNPSNSVIISICREFNVNEDWLRTGNGEMFKESPLRNEVGYYVEELLEDYKDNPFYDMIIGMMKTYAESDDKSKKVLRNCASKFLDNIKNAGD